MTEAPAIKPIDPENPDVRKAALIDIARQRGVPWETIAAVLDLPDKAAAKRLRRELGQRIRRSQMIG